ncbi:MAG: hypothetical protein WCO67_15355, partial [Betaproteobacteria bacterium]
NAVPTDTAAKKDVPPSGNAAATNVVKRIGTKPGSWQFPLLTSPSSMFGLLMGKEVVLFQYDLPSLDLQFLYEQVFPIFPGLNAKLAGEITATTNFTFGLTTRGFIEFQAGGYRPQDIPIIFTKGFFLSDHGIQGTPSDKPEATLTLKITAGASVGIGGLIEVGVEGYIKAQVNFDLHDDPNPGTGLRINNNAALGYAVPPVYDGRIYLEELLNDIDCIFDIYGDITVGLDAYFWVGVKIFGAKITIFSARHTFFTATLYDFNFTCIDETPTLATLSGTTLNLLLEPQTKDGVTKGDRFIVTETMLDDYNSSGQALGTQTAYYKVSARGASNYFRKADVGLITSSGSAYDDEIVIDGTVDANIAIHGGGGNDRLLVSALAGSTKTRHLYGDAGDDTLIGSDLADTLDGGTGNDSLYGMKGNDTINGEAGNDTLYGGRGDDTISGGVGDDQIFGEDDNDILTGDAGLDTIYGGSGNDRIDGGDDADTLFGDVGNDSLYGGAGGDVLNGGKGLDYLSGGAGVDRIVWVTGDGADPFIDGGSTANEADILSISTAVVDKPGVTSAPIADTITINTVTLTASMPDPLGGTGFTREAAGVATIVNGFALNATHIESIQIDVGSGADNVDIGDLKGSRVQEVTVDLGVGSGTIKKTAFVNQDIVVTPVLSSGAASFTLRGVAREGAVWTVDLGNKTYSYTVLATDTTLANIATGLRSVIAAGTLYTATASGEVLSVNRVVAAATVVNTTLTIPQTGGEFIIDDGVEGAVLASTATAADIRTALAGFASIASATVTAGSPAGTFTIGVQSVGALRPLSVSEFVGAKLDTAAVTTTYVLTVPSSGNFTLSTPSSSVPGTYTKSVAFNATAANIKSALLDLTALKGTTITVTAGTGSAAGTWKVAIADGNGAAAASLSASGGASLGTADVVLSQRLTVSRTAGSYSIGYGTGATTSSALAYNANAAAIDAALERLTGIGAGKATVKAGPTEGTWDIEIRNPAQALDTTHSLAVRGLTTPVLATTASAALSITGVTGSYTLTDGTNSVTLPWNTTAAGIQAVLEKFANIGTGHVTVTAGTGAGNFAVAFTGLATYPRLAINAATGFTARDIEAFNLKVADVPAGVTTTYALTVPSSGNFTLSTPAPSGSTTGTYTKTVAFDATAATIKTALRELTALANTYITVTQGAGGAWKVAIIAADGTAAASLTASGGASLGTAEVVETQAVAQQEFAMRAERDANGSTRIAAGTVSGTEDMDQRVEQKLQLTLSGTVKAGNRW